MTGFRRTILMVAVAALEITDARASEPCLNDASDTQRVTGTLSIERVKDGLGRFEWPYLLTLATPVCLTTEDPTDRVDGTRSIHIFATDQTIATQFSRYVGASIVVRGRLFSAHTPHHHAPIVMEIAEIGVQ